MPFWFICETMNITSKMSGKGSQDQIRETVCNLFRSAIAVNPSEVASIFYFFIMKLAPDFAGVEMGIGHEVCVKAVSKACGKSIA